MAPATASPVPGFLASVFLGAILWAYVYLFFTTNAVVLDLSGPFHALRSSIAVVRHYFWSTLAFICLILIIGNGIPIILEELATQVQLVGTPIAILGYIYITSGLAAASMTYYKERIEHLMNQQAR